MAEDVKKEEKKTDENQEVKLFNQEDINRIVGERLAKEKEKYKDFEEYKKAKVKLDEIENANKTELDKAKAETDQFKKLAEQKDLEVKQLGIENLKLSLLDLAGLPKNWAKRKGRLAYFSRCLPFRRNTSIIPKARNLSICYSV